MNNAEITIQTRLITQYNESRGAHLQWGGGFYKGSAPPPFTGSVKSKISRHQRVLGNCESARLLYHTPLPHSSTTHLYHTPLPHSSTTHLYHTTLPHFSTTLLYHTPLPHSSTTLLYHTLLPHSSTTLLYRFCNCKLVVQSK